MIHTKDNPKLVEDYYYFEGRETFTGVVKDKYSDIVYYYLNGKYHRTDGPAIESSNGTKIWYLNGLCHREYGPACEYDNVSKSWYLNDTLYGVNDDYTNESWIRFVKLELLK